MFRTLIPRALIALPLLVGACDRPVTVRITVPDLAGQDTPLAGARFLVLPYDRDSLLVELERRAPSARPSTARLDSLFQVFREPFTAYLRRSADRDRLQRARDSLQARAGLGPPAPAGAADAERLAGPRAAVEDSLATLAPELEAAQAALASARRRVVPEIDSLRRRLAAWEDTAYRSYDSITSRLVRRREAITDSTGPTGWATLRLGAGAWWITARTVNVLDPNAEWYWNVRVAGDTIRLDRTNGRARPRP